MQKRTRGRPSQDKVVRPYTLDKSIAEFIDNLPDGERSRFVNNILAVEKDLGRLSGKYYNYVLLRPNGVVFYIGKGTGDRIDDHEREARRGVQSRKCDIIREIWAEGESVIKQKIAFFDEEKDAYALEVYLIDFWGIENLANVENGGNGIPGGPRKSNILIDEESAARLRDLAASLGFYIRRGPGTGEVGNIKELLDILAQAYQAMPEKTQKMLSTIIQDLEKQQMTAALKEAFEAFLNDEEEFSSTIIQSTIAGFSGSGFSVELFPDKTYRVLWDNAIGNRYEPEGRIMGVIKLSDEDYRDLCEVAGSSARDELVKELKGSSLMYEIAEEMRSSWDDAEAMREEYREEYENLAPEYKN